MTLYILIYVCAIWFSLYGGYLVYKIYKNLFWFFFFLSTFFMSLWFVLFFMFFSGIESVEMLLLISRLCFWVWVLATYSLLFSLYFLNTWKNKIMDAKKKYWLIWFYIFILILYTGSDFIIESLHFSPSEMVYREKPWILFWFHFSLQTIFILSFVVLSFLKVKNQSYINRLRLRYILYSAYFLIFLVFIFQLVLPTFWIRLFEKELILFFLLFIMWVVYIIKRYYFTNIFYSIWKIIIGTLWIILSTTMVIIMNELYIMVDNWFWWVQLYYGPIIVSILFFIVFYKVLSFFFLPQATHLELEKSIKKLEKNISIIYNREDLDLYLQKELKVFFKINFCQLCIFQEWELSELKDFFEKDVWNKFFIHDIVFIEENKAKFDKNKITKNLHPESFLIFPLFNTLGINIWFLTFGKKIFWDFYDKAEIEIMQNFIFFLEYHLKYIQSFEKIQYLSINLDKKIDEKTMEYNHLINKQKEFISLVSHEIRSPIVSAIFQADSILDDIKAWEKNIKYLQSELKVLNSILVNIWELVNKLFSVQYYDTHNVTLYKQNIDIATLIKDEIEIQKHIHKNISFIDKIDRSIWLVKIDKVQFLQVIQNLLSNSIKFLPETQKIIEITAFIENNILVISIADNGNGFWQMNVSKIFEKYSIGKTSSLWLGLGLYLCKRIIEMHSGIISAGISEKFNWAEFTIKIPVVQE